MEALSVMASVAGLLKATHEVGKLLKPYVSASRETPSIAAHVRGETESTRTVLLGSCPGGFLEGGRSSASIRSASDSPDHFLLWFGNFNSISLPSWVKTVYKISLKPKSCSENNDD